MSAELDLAGIRARAEAATPGPWHVTHSGVSIYSTNRTSVGMAGSILAHGSELGQGTDAAHIAGMDPVTTLALVAEVERLRGLVESSSQAGDMDTAVEAGVKAFNFSRSGRMKHFDVVRAMEAALTAARPHLSMRPAPVADCEGR